MPKDNRNFFEKKKDWSEIKKHFAWCLSETALSKNLGDYFRLYEI